MNWLRFLHCSMEPGSICKRDLGNIENKRSKSSYFYI